MELKKLTFVKRYVSDKYKTKKMGNKAIIGNGGML